MSACGTSTRHCAAQVSDELDGVGDPVVVDEPGRDVDVRGEPRGGEAEHVARLDGELVGVPVVDRLRQPGTAQHQAVRSGGGDDDLVPGDLLAVHPRPDLAVVGADHPGVRHLDTALEAGDPAQQVGPAVLHGHHVEQLDDAGGRGEGGLHDGRGADVPPRDLVVPGRADLPVAVLLGAEQRREAGGGVEAGEAHPVHRAVEPDQGCGVTVAEQGVVLDRLRHGDTVAGRPATGPGPQAPAGSSSTKRAPLARRVQGEVAAVAPGHGAGDGQPQPAAAVVPRPGRVATVEPLEDQLGVLGRHARTVVHDLDADAVTVHPGSDAHRGRGVAGGVLEQVAHQPAQLAGVAAHRRRGDPRHLELYVGRRTQPGGFLEQEVVQVDGDVRRRGSAAVVRGQEQQVADQPLHVGGAGQQVTGEGASAGTSTAPDDGQGDLELRALGGQGALQVVGGVGDEVALAGAGGLEPREHAVHRGGQPADLVVDRDWSGPGGAAPPR